MKMRMVNRYLILGILLASNIPAIAGEYWIRPDGTDGTGDGSAGNPWVRTTGITFDALVNSSTSRQNSAIHLMAGLFHTQSGIHVQPYWKIRGAGIDVTTVQIDSQDGVTNIWDLNGFPVIGSDAGYDGVEVSDLTA